jgi:hypothetical protein
MNLSKEEAQTFEDFNDISYSNRKNLSKLSSQIETKKEMILFIKLQEAYNKLEQAEFYLNQLEVEFKKLEAMIKVK